MRSATAPAAPAARQRIAHRVPYAPLTAAGLLAFHRVLTDEASTAVGRGRPGRAWDLLDEADEVIRRYAQVRS